MVTKMTNEEAITILKREFSECKDTISVYAQKRKKAFDMAIKALEQQPKTGHWIFKNDNIAIPTGYYQCSECEEGKLLVKDNFCPNCGSYNGGGENDVFN